MPFLSPNRQCQSTEQSPSVLLLLVIRKVTTAYHVLPGRRLQYSSEESCGKREGRQPEDHRRMSGGRPLLKLVNSQDQVTSP